MGTSLSPKGFFRAIALIGDQRVRRALLALTEGMAGPVQARK